MLGDDALKVYNSFHFLTPTEQRTPKEILVVFNRYAVDETNVTYDHLVFHMRKQEETMSVDAFIPE